MKNVLKLPVLIALVIGNMVGTGIYILPSSLASYGTLSLLSWMLTTIGAILFAFTIVDLNKRIPQSGGPFVYCEKAFGNLVGFMTAYSYYFGNLISIAGVAVATIGYLGFIYPIFDANTPSYHSYWVFMAEVAAIWLFTLINIIGLQAAGKVQFILTILKIIPLFGIGLLGLSKMHLANLTQFTVHGETPSFSMLSSAAALTFWGFIGLEAATVPADNTEGHRSIYQATLFGMLVTAFIYIFCTFVLMGMIPVTSLMKSQFPFAQAGAMLFGAGGALFITICAIVSGLGTLNACILVQGQLIFAAARDRLFPHRLAKLSKNHVPIAGQIISAIILTIFLLATMQPTLLQQFDTIALIAVFLILFTYLMTCLSELRFQIKENDSLIKALTSRSSIVAILAVIYTFWMMNSFRLKISLISCGILFCCIPLYFLTLKMRKN